MGACLAQSEELVTLDLEVVSVSSMLDVELLKRINKLKKKCELTFNISTNSFQNKLHPVL